MKRQFRTSIFRALIISLFDFLLQLHRKNYQYPAIKTLIIGKRLYTFSAGILLSFSIMAQSYTLTDDDVVVTDGVIEICFYDFALRDIIVPEILDGQTVTAIGNDFVFASKGITSVILPATIDTIGIAAFAENEITSITLPSSIIAIGDEAFINNPLESVSFPALLNYIGSWAFSGTRLISISLPESLTYIGPFAFQLSALNNVTIPTSVNYIGEHAFAENNLMSVTFEENSNIEVIDGMAFYDNPQLGSIKLPTIATPGYNIFKDGYGNIFYPGDNISDFELNYFIDFESYTLTDDDVIVIDGVIESCSYDFAIKNIVIPETLDGQTVTAIGSNYPYPFYNKGITSVILPETLVSINTMAFYNNSLTNINIPSSVTIISDYAFAGNSLAHLNIPPSVNYIGNGAFSFNSLSIITIPASVTYIGEKAFYINALINVSFEENSNIGNIRNEAFSGNIGLNSIALPTNANSGFTHYTDGNGNILSPGDNISDFATNYYIDIPYTLTDDDVEVINGVIESCSYDLRFSNIIIPETLDGQTITAIGYKNYSNNRPFAGKGISKISLPSTLEIIGVSAFSSNSLTRVTIPASVSHVGRLAFSYNSLANIIFEENSSIKYIGWEAFDNNSGLSLITLPTNIDPGFVHYKDGNGNTYLPGDNISDFSTSYYADIPYTLTDDDVVVINGIIESCSYNIAYSNITIPQTLDGQLCNLFSVKLSNHG